MSSKQGWNQTMDFIPEHGLSRQGANRSAALFQAVLGQGQTDKIHTLVQFQVMNVPQDTERRGLINNSSNCILLNAGTSNQRNYL